MRSLFPIVCSSRSVSRGCSQGLEVSGVGLKARVSGSGRGLDVKVGRPNMGGRCKVVYS